MALAVIAVLAIGAAGCGSGEKGVDVRKVAFVAPFGDNEPDWTLRARAVVADWPRQRGVRVDIADASQAGDVRDVLEQVSHEDNQLVIAHDSRYADAAEAVAKDTKVPELVWGERPDAPDGLIGQMTVQDKESGYMAGVIAARAAITRRLGIIVIADGSDWDTQTWNRMAGGFAAGARSVDPREIIDYVQVGEDGQATAQEVKAAALRLQDRGSQMIFALGGAATVGALRGVEERGGENLFVGVISEKEEFNRENFVLAAIVYEFKPAFELARQDLRAGKFGDRRYELTIRNGGLRMFSTGRTPIDAYEAGIEAGRKIQAGKLRVPVTTTREAVEALIAGQAPQG